MVWQDIAWHRSNAYRRDVESCRTTSAHEPQKQTMKAKHTLVAAGAAATIRSGLLDGTRE
jgi:hypothetical protein